MKITKSIPYAIALAVVMLCEAAFVKYIAIGGAIPMLGFCFCVTAAFFAEDSALGVGWAGIFGCAQDLLTGHGFGTYTLMFLLCTAAVYAIKDSVFSSRILMLALLAFLLSIAVNAVYYIFHITEIGGNIIGKLSSPIIPCALYDTVVSLAFYPICRRIYGKRR